MSGAGVFLVLFFVGVCAAAPEKLVYAQLGRDVELRSPFGTDKYVTWYIGGADVAWSNPSGGRKILETEWRPRLELSSNGLVIKNVTRGEFGAFSCVARDKKIETGRQLFKLVQVEVVVDPPVLVSGQWLSLSCSVPDPGHAPRVHWVGPKGQTPETSGGGARVRTTADHSGDWTYVLTDQNERTTGTVNVRVIDLLPLAPVQTVFTSSSSPLLVPCSLAPGASWTDVRSRGVVEVGWNFCPNVWCDKPRLLTLSLESKPTWTTAAKGRARPKHDPGNGDLSLGRNVGRDGDAGAYECFIRFKDGEILNRTVRVEVLRIVASPGTRLNEGDPLNLTCTTGRPPRPDLQIKWLPPSSLSALRPPPHISIPSAGGAENGTWTCELWRGEELLTSTRVELRIESKFSVWMLVTLCALAAILILLVVLIIIIQRRRQRRSRRHMRLCQCKNPKPKGFYRS
ncbi:CD4-1 molecule isoform X1 [Periophthalmus magnuspinnatus]|uniref:CD4-1 molecule isoform X1 n=1 Tax=Periophthalmus magnuspinnatus TaxID=409849 RepID=UPI0024364C61|nr:CD4-1 molecule isoform X1 [Periophthalmus magnuspinnatus]